MTEQISHRSDRLFSAGAGLTVLQLLMLVIATGSGEIAALRYAGFALWIVAVIFATVPIWTLSKHGGAPEDTSYMETTQLVTSGPYALVRHPQFLGALLLNLALMLVSQHVLIIGIGAVAAYVNLRAGAAADQSSLAQFGDAYHAYMREVPRFNLVVGLLRWVRRTIRTQIGTDTHR